MMFNATRLLDEEFKTHNLKYSIREKEEIQIIDVPFGIQNGPSVIIHYITSDQRNDLSIQITDLAHNVPDEKRIRMLETINTLKKKYRFIKFTLDSDNDLDVKADFPSTTSDESLGPMAFEMFVRIMRIMGDAYPKIARTLYSLEDTI